MRLSSTVIAGLLGAALLATGASAQEQKLRKWGDSGLWGIWINPVFNNGCLMRGVFSGGTEVRAGIDNRNGDRYLALFNDAWAVNPGQQNSVSFDLDGTKYETEATQMAEHGRQGGAAFASDPAFVDSFASSQKMTIFVDGQPLTAIDLTGSAAAVEAVRACQAEQG